MCVALICRKQDFVVINLLVSKVWLVYKSYIRNRGVWGAKPPRLEYILLCLNKVRKGIR